MATKTIILELDIEEGEESTVKELLAYLSYTKRIRKYIWKEKEAVSFKAAADRTNETGMKAAEKRPVKPLPLKPTELSPAVAALHEQLTAWRKQDKLIRLKALKGKGQFLDIACKIVSQDPEIGTVTVYDVDRKVVETIRLTEIEDMNLAL